MGVAVQGSPEIVVSADAAEATRRMAERFVGMCDAAAGVVSVALSGGGTPQRLYETLAAPPYRDAIPWPRVELFFGDERAVPPEHPESNYGMVRRALLEPLGIEAHRMVAERGAATAYEQLIAARVEARRDGFPVFDLVLLGIGPDGHTASLFPGTAAVDEAKRWVVMNEVPQKQTSRMTLTFPVINRARRVWILATGAEKEEIVATCLGAARDDQTLHRWPITGVHPDGELIWWLDQGSAARLSK
jgi:6-phosphogluconolactonase